MPLWERRGKRKRTNQPQNGPTAQPQNEVMSQPPDGPVAQLQNDQGHVELSATLEERYGLFTFGDTRSTDYNIDIVTVHGLGGHWMDTWTHANGKLWLRDFLPSQLPRARIMSYGYNSDTAFSSGVTDIREAAMTLLDRLDGERQLPEEKKRPIIFISHSLGGIVVKKALILAHERSSLYRDLLGSVRGSVFFGVPHRGSDAAYWLSFAANLLKVTTLGRTNTSFVTALQRNSREFADISQQFIERAPSLQIRTFYETMKYYNQLIVDSDSACLGLPNEIAVGVAGANHRDVCKFSDANSQKYLQVGRAIERLVNSAISASAPSAEPLSKEETECLRCLYTSDYESHKRNNPPRVSGTLEWFLEHEKYEHWWQEQESSLLWVSADPGYGKSVLASFLVDEFNGRGSQLILPSTVCYFFYKDGYEEQNNAKSALCALLHQLFKEKTCLIKHAMKEFEQKGQRFTEEFGSLWEIFRAATTDSDCGNIICVIDGLDECEQSTRDQFIDSLVGIYTPAEPTSFDPGKMFLKFIVTSRPYGSIERKFRSLPSIRLKAENETTAISADIELVIKARVNELGEIWDLPDDVRSTLQDRLLTGADRTFLWVSLILSILKDTAMASQSEFSRIINNLPSDLDATYERILGKSVDPGKARTILHIVVAAARPLTLEEMDIALAIQPSHKSIEDLKPYRMFLIESAVKDLCGLFVRVIDSKIYLVHQTAKEFLSSSSITDPPIPGTWKHSLHPVESNLTLANICARYLLFAVFETHPLVIDSEAGYGSIKAVAHYTKGHVFLDYAAEHWAVHFKESQEKEDQELINYAFEVCDTNSRRFLTWFQVYWSSVEPNRKCPSNLTGLMVASYFGHETVVRRLLERGTDVNARGGLYGSALNAAAFMGHHNVIQMLLNNGAIVYLFRREYKNLPEVSAPTVS